MSPTLSCSTLLSAHQRGKGASARIQGVAVAEKQPIPAFGRLSAPLRPTDPKPGKMVPKNGMTPSADQMFRGRPSHRRELKQPLIGKAPKKGVPRKRCWTHARNQSRWWTRRRGLGQRKRLKCGKHSSTLAALHITILPLVSPMYVLGQHDEDKTTTQEVELAAMKEELAAIKQLLEQQYQQANKSAPPNTESWPLELSLDGQPKEQT